MYAKENQNGVIINKNTQTVMLIWHGKCIQCLIGVSVFGRCNCLGFIRLSSNFVQAFTKHARIERGENIMQRKIRIQFIVLFAFLLVLLGVAASFASPALAADSASTVIRLSVDNASQFPFYLYLYGAGGQEYSISVPAYSDGKLFIQPGDYAYYMEACNYSKYGTMALPNFQTIHVPVCGGRAAGFKHSTHHIDVATIMKPVRVKIRNKTGEDIGVYVRTQEDHHFLNLKKGEVIEVILKKEEGIQYVYSFQACGGQLIAGYYTPMAKWPLDLKCPKE